MPTYRSGTAADIPVLAQLWHDMLVESGVAGSGFVAEWRERLERHFAAQMGSGLMAWFVAQEGGHVVGCAAAFLSTGRSNVLLDVHATLAGIYTVPGFRKRGIARELTLRAIEWCKQQNCVSIRLQASEAGRPLYESLGFRAFHEMMKLDLH
jgi:GNAT superfamily N-acetyltransferase